MVSSIIAAKSSFLPREFVAMVGGASTMETESACGPRRPSAIENSSFVPDLAGLEEMIPCCRQNLK